MKNKIILIVILMCSISHSRSLDQIIETLKYVETNNNYNSIGDNGKAFGVLQIHNIVIKEINNYYGLDYVHDDAFDICKAEEIFRYYIGIGIIKYKNKYKKHPSEEDIVRFWNGGIYSGHLRKTTIKYYNRYLYYKSYLKRKKLRNNKYESLNKEELCI